ncbi:MAG: hypothetical protein Q8M94_19050 [Ignavibacteria bacterium]|nr:hypothetical protein [Ignavibacteria bacterium]
MAEINLINLEWKENTAWYNDCESMTDYFHMTSGSLRYIISRIQEKGAKEISVTVTNNDPTIPAERRVNQICKACGYSAKNLSENRTRTYSRYPDNQEMSEEYKHLEWLLTKIN